MNAKIIITLNCTISGPCAPAHAVQNEAKRESQLEELRTERELFWLAQKLKNQTGNNMDGAIKAYKSQDAYQAMNRITFDSTAQAL